MVKRFRGVLVGLVSLASVAAASFVSAPSASAVHPSSASARPSGARCVMEAFGLTRSGRITYRQVVNTRTALSRTTRAPVRWRPVGWGLASYETWPGTERTHQVVASTDGKVRLVETEWRSAGGALKVRVVRVVGRGYHARLATFTGHELYWVGADHALHRARWTGSRLVRPVRLPVSLKGATAMTSYRSARGNLLYYTDRAGALRVVVDDGARSADAVLTPSGYRGVTGLRSGPCSRAGGARSGPSVALMSVDRRTGVGRFQRVLHPSRLGESTVTRPSRVRPSDWTWRRFG